MTQSIDSLAEELFEKEIKLRKKIMMQFIQRRKSIGWHELSEDVQEVYRGLARHVKAREIKARIEEVSWSKKLTIYDEKTASIYQYHISTLEQEMKEDDD